MPAKKINPLEQHIEKGVLGLAALVLLYCLIAYMISSPVTGRIGTEIVRPGEGYKLVWEKADALERQAQREPLPEIKVLNPNSTTTKPRPLEPLDPGLAAPLPAVAPFGPELEKVRDPELETRIKQVAGGRKYPLPKVLAPKRQKVHMGRSALDLSQIATREGDGPGSELTDTSWVTVVAEIDVKEQRKLLAYLPDREEIEKEPIFIGAELERAEVDDQGKLGEWVKVAPIESEVSILGPDNSLKVKTIDELRVIRDEILSNPEQVQAIGLNPAFPRVISGRQWATPTVAGEKPKPATEEKGPQVREVSKVEKKIRQPVKRERGPGVGGRVPGGRAARGGRGGGIGAGGRPMAGAGRGMRGRPGMGMPGMGPMMDDDMMGPGMFGPGTGLERGLPGRDIRERVTMARGPGKLEKTDRGDIKVWAHDLTATPGRTYRYRIRVIMFNPLAGYSNYLENIDRDTLQVGIAGPWSAPSEPVTIEKEMYFFVAGPASNGSARVTVYKWYKGWLVDEKFTVQVGQEIGGKDKTRFGDEATQTEEKVEVDFSTGAVLLDVTQDAAVPVIKKSGKRYEVTVENGATVIVVRDRDTRLVKQDSINVRSDPAFARCDEIKREQKKKLSAWKKTAKAAEKSRRSPVRTRTIRGAGGGRGAEM